MRYASTDRRWYAAVLRWTLRATVLLGAVLGLLALPLACTTRIIPPAGLRESVTVIVVDHGDTPSLVLPAEDSAMIRYAYGEWKWYALGDTGYRRVIPTLLCPTQGTLGRQEMGGAISEAAVRDKMQVGFESLHSVQVEQEQVRRLRWRLDTLYEQNIGTHVFNPRSDLHFVHHPRRYTYFYNSNHMLAAWLQELGCEVRGPAYASRWRVEPASW